MHKIMGSMFVTLQTPLAQLYMKSSYSIVKVNFFLIFRSLEFLGVYYSSLHRFKHLCIKSNIIWWSHTPTFNVQYRSIIPYLKFGLLDFNLIKTELCALILRGLKVKICLYFSYWLTFWFEITEGHICDLIGKFRSNGHRNFLVVNEVRPRDKTT